MKFGGCHPQKLHRVKCRGWRLGLGLLCHAHYSSLLVALQQHLEHTDHLLIKYPTSLPVQGQLGAAPLHLGRNGDTDEEIYSYMFN